MKLRGRRQSRLLDKEDKAGEEYLSSRWLRLQREAKTDWALGGSHPSG